MKNTNKGETLYEYVKENSNEYEITFYCYKDKSDIFLFKFWQNTVDGEDTDIEIACTKEECNEDDIQIDEDTMITKEKFENLYKKYKNKFQLDMLNEI